MPNSMSSLPYDPSLLYSMGLANQAGLPNPAYPINYNRYHNRYYPQQFHNPIHNHTSGLQSRSGSIGGSGSLAQSGGLASNSLSHILDTFFDPANRLKVRDHAAKIEITENGDFNYKLDVSGFDAEDINVAVEQEFIVIRGEHKSETPGKLFYF